jgi:ERCC4-related helicase
VGACFSINGIPASACAKMDGSVMNVTRVDIWRQRRMFYCTPQTLANDLAADRLDPQKIVCIVIDEAHRTKGEYAYCKVGRSFVEEKQR